MSFQGLTVSTTKNSFQLVDAIRGQITNYFHKVHCHHALDSFNHQRRRVAGFMLSEVLLHLFQH
ncbi:hypothetical protein ACVWWB_002453 [Ewingella americana]